MLLVKVPVLVIVHPKTNKFDSGGMIKATGHLKFMKALGFNRIWEQTVSQFQ